MPRIILSDYDGVWIDSHRNSVRCMRDLNTRHSLGITDDDLKTYFRDHRRIFDRYDSKQAAQLKLEYASLRGPHPIVEDALPVFEYLQGRLYIVTDRSESQLENGAMLSGFPLERVSGVVTRDKVEKRKPSHVFLEHAFQISGCEEGFVPYVFDSLDEIEMVKAVNRRGRITVVPIIIYKTGTNSKEEFLAVGIDPKNIIETVAELPDALRRCGIC